MPVQVARISRAVFGGALLMACADATPPTQPREIAVKPRAGRAATDVVPTTETAPATLFACYVPGKGTVYRIKTADTPAECDRKDVQFSVTSDRGSAPIKGIEFHSAQVTLNSTGRIGIACVEGKFLVNFGWEIPGNSTATASQIRANRPTLVSGAGRWLFVAEPATIYIFYWNCADADPSTEAP